MSAIALLSPIADGLPSAEQADEHNITAHLEDGVLTLTLNKKPEAKPRRITVH